MVVLETFNLEENGIEATALSSAGVLPQHFWEHAELEI